MGVHPWWRCVHMRVIAPFLVPEIIQYLDTTTASCLSICLVISLLYFAWPLLTLENWPVMNVYSMATAWGHTLPLLSAWFWFRQQQLWIYSHNCCCVLVICKSVEIITNISGTLLLAAMLQMYNNIGWTSWNCATQWRRSQAGRRLLPHDGIYRGELGALAAIVSCILFTASRREDGFVISWGWCIACGGSRSSPMMECGIYVLR